MIINKKRAFFENKLTESIGKPKNLWKALRSIGLPSKTSSCEVNALKMKNTVEHDDLQKAFDTIDHDILLQKLYAICFSKHTVNWFKSYLSNRSFLVNLENNFSQPASVSCGVPQGSILGPLLFLIY